MVARFLNADSYISTGQGILGFNMFAYCRNNPVCRKDVYGTMEVDCFEGSNDDKDPLNDVGKPHGGDSNQTAGATVGTPENGYSYTVSGTSQASNRGPANSIYTQYSSDGKNSIVSQTTYNEFGLPGQRIDYQGRDHGIGLPHIHIFSWILRDGNLFRNGEEISLYIMP